MTEFIEVDHLEELIQYFRDNREFQQKTYKDKSTTHFFWKGSFQKLEDTEKFQARGETVFKTFEGPFLSTYSVYLNSNEGKIGHAKVSNEYIELLREKVSEL